MLGRAAFVVLAALVAASGMAACSALQPNGITAPAIDPAQGPASLSVRRRAAVWGSGPAHEILLDGQLIARLEPSETKTVQVPAGIHEVEVWCGGEASSTITQTVFEAGRSYQIDVYQSNDPEKQPICQLRPIGS
jgi:hypothetical protein